MSRFFVRTHSTVLILLFSLPLSSAIAATFNVDSTVDAVDSTPGDGICQTSNSKCTLRAAIQESNALAGLDTIILPSGTYKPVLGSIDEDSGLEGDFDITDDVNIEGSGSDRTILTGNINQYRIIHTHARADRTLPKISISNVKLTRGLEDNIAAVIYNNANLTLDKVIINKAGLGSNAVYNLGYLTISNSTLNENSRAVRSNNAHTIIDNSLFSLNKTTTQQAYGAAYYGQNSFQQISNSSFDNNSSNRGGAIYYTGTTHISDSSFDANTSSYYGGAIYSSGSLLTLIRSDFTNNISGDGTSSYGTGGAIYLSQGQNYFNESLFSANKSRGKTQGNGGAIYASNYASTYFVDLTITGNEASRSGGGIYLYSPSSTSHRVIENSIITGNTAIYFGGGLGTEGNTTIRNSLIAGNHANKGGGVYAYRGVNRIDNSTLSGNTADQTGGAVFYEDYQNSNTDKLDIKNSTIANNTAPVNKGGNITNTGKRLRILNTIVANAQNGIDCEGNLISLGYNLSSDDSCNFIEMTDLSSTDPQLEDLADNGGNSHTHALKDDSPAIGVVVGEYCFDVDQRYFYRKDAQTCDIGAYESNAIRAVSGNIGFSAPTFNVGEADGTATISLVRKGGNEGTVSLRYYDFGGGSANAGYSRDYSFTEDDITWGDGDSDTKSFEISITDDYTKEGIETALITLRNLFGGARFSDNQTALLRIIDDDVQYGSMRFSASTYSVKETDAVVNIKVSRTSGSYGNVTIDYHTEDSSALAGEDYTATRGTLEFAHDQVEAGISIPLIDDPFQEGDEYFKIILDNPTDGATLGFPVLANVTIAGNDNEGLPEPTTPGNGTNNPSDGGTQNDPTDPADSNSTPSSSSSSGGGGSVNPIVLMIFSLVSFGLIQRRRKNTLNALIPIR